MTRIPLRDLKEALSNPAKYARSFQPGRDNGFPRPSKYGMLLFAIGEFHKTNDLQRAQKYLETAIVKNFKHVSDLSKYVTWLHLYAREFRALGNNCFKVRNNIAIPLPPKFSGMTVSGQAARIDLSPSGGYAVWVFVRNAPDWKEDPRMPLLQLAYSKRLGVGIDDVTVGTFDFVLTKHTSTQYSIIRINRVQRALWKLILSIQRKK